MTVAAIILPLSLDEAIADTAGRPAARRMVESAWAGGATPIIVICADQGDRLALALAGSPAILAELVPGGDIAAQLARGAQIAAERVTETDAALVWPGAMVWVDAETVTSLIEAHGAQREHVLRPRYGESAGWPMLVPLPALLDGLSPGAADADALAELLSRAAALRLLDTGDPGTVFDSRTSMDELPAYDGPPEPVAGPPPEWGAQAADLSDEGPLQGPALAPYGQATDEVG